MQPIETVRAIYEAFGRGDIPAILEHLDEDVEWEYGLAPSGVPWLEPRRGRAGVAGFFEALSALEFRVFEPRTLLPADGLVVALIYAELTVRATGRRIVEEDEVHLWRFDREGRVIRFSHKVDSHQHWVAYHGRVAVEA